MSYEKIENETCRICNAVLKNPEIILRNMPLTDEFVSVDDLSSNEFLKDILIYECKRCGFVQNPINFSYAEYYKDYNYSSGHSEFTKNFFNKYTEIMDDLYLKVNGKKAASVIEAGSGDGMQLSSFKEIGYEVLGIEPSDYLVKVANDAGINTDLELFNTDLSIQNSFDICISSYTFDHMPDPIDYLKTAHQVLRDGGLAGVEVHDLERIVDRTEFCLFEHEHTIYMTPGDIVKLVESQGFEVISINPLDESTTRANSLFIVARKNNITSNPATLLHTEDLFLTLGSRIDATISKLDKWVSSISEKASIIGYGAGGRGVMTLAAMNSYKRFSALVDSNYNSDVYLAPKTRIPICSKDDLSNFNDGYCLIFSFGYADEITNDLLAAGFLRENILLLSDFYT